MKVYLKVIFVSLVLSCLQSSKIYAQNIVVSYQVFYDELSPYGQWVDDPQYGFIWVPDVSPGFYPYSTSGHWVYTSYGWTWVSDYPWGWAPFHYGRWDYNPFYGWVWLPSYEWGPAWVTWRHYNGYYGWAPLGPNVTVVQSFRSYDIPADRWRFVRERDIAKPNLGRYYVDRSRNPTYIRNSTVIQNTYVDKSRGTTYVYGPRREDVQKQTNTVIKPVAIRDYSKPGQKVSGNQVNIYRPRFQQASDNAQKPVPAKVIKKEEFKARGNNTQIRNNTTASKPGLNRTQQTSPPNNAQTTINNRQKANQSLKQMPSNNRPAQPVPAQKNKPVDIRRQTQIQQTNPNTMNQEKSKPSINKQQPNPQQRPIIQQGRRDIPAENKIRMQENQSQRIREVQSHQPKPVQQRQIQSPPINTRIESQQKMEQQQRMQQPRELPQQRIQQQPQPQPQRMQQQMPSQPRIEQQQPRQNPPNNRIQQMPQNRKH